MIRRAVIIALASVAATALGACAAAPGATGASVTVSLTPERGHPGRWCASAVDAREPDARLSVCLSSRARAVIEAVVGVDCPTHRVVLVGRAPRRLQSVSVRRGASSKSATLAHREAVSALAAAVSLSDFPARLRTTAGSRVRSRALRDPHSFCRSVPRATGVIDAFQGPRRASPARSALLARRFGRTSTGSTSPARHESATGSASSAGFDRGRPRSEPQRQVRHGP